MDNLIHYLQSPLSHLHGVDYIGSVYSGLRLAAANLLQGNLAANITTSATSLTLIAAAEMGDKSQLACMTLASRHRATPVLLGAIAAFAFLNGIAVIFGVALASWLPEYLIAAIVSGLFAIFGLYALRIKEDEPEENVKEKKGHTLFFTTFALITVAEFGDKTQLSVVALSSTAAAFPVWLGATLALAITSALGVTAG